VGRALRSLIGRWCLRCLAIGSVMPEPKPDLLTPDGVEALHRAPINI
jgi:hypothetical protein